MYQNRFLKRLGSYFNLQLKPCISIIFITCFSFLSAEVEYHYTIHDLGTLYIGRDTPFIELNDNGQIALSSLMEKEKDDPFENYNYKFGFWDIHNGFSLLPLKDGEKIDQIIKINNHGWMIGKGEREIRMKYKNENCDDDERYYYKRDYSGPIIWNSTTCELIYLNEKLKLIDINDQNQVLGYDKESESYFIFENHEYKYLDFNNNLSQFGSHPIDISLLEINNQGNIIGKFEYGTKHPYKDKWRSVGKQYFLWNGQINLIANMNQSDRSYENLPFILTDESEVFFKISDYHQKELYKWDLLNGTQVLDNKSKPLFLDFKNMSHNMRHSIEGNGGQFRIWRDGKIMSINNFSAGGFFCLFDRSLYPEVEFKSLKQINNQGQIILMGQVWGETHYFLLNPIQ